MKGREFIDWLRREGGQVVLPPAGAILADAVEEADYSFRSMIESECPREGAATAENAQAGWWNTERIIDGTGDSFEADGSALVERALSYLDRRGMIERKPDAPHMVRFVEEGAK